MKKQDKTSLKKKQTFKPAQNPQASLYQYVNQEFPDVQAEFRKVRRIKDQIAKIHWIRKNKRILEKHLLLFH